MITPERFNAFKAAVAALEFTTDTVELDRRLMEVSTLLYYTRQEIDDEWYAARQATIKRVAKIRHKPLSDTELESILDIIRGNQ